MTHEERLQHQLDLANALLAVYGIKYDETKHVYVIPSFATKDYEVASTESLSKRN